MPTDKRSKNSSEIKAMDRLVSSFGTGKRIKISQMEFFIWHKTAEQEDISETSCTTLQDRNKKKLFRSQSCCTMEFVA